MPDRPTPPDNPPASSAFVTLAENLTRGEAEELASLLASAGLLSRAGEELPVGGELDARRSRWVLEVDAGQVEHAERLLSEGLDEEEDGEGDDGQRAGAPEAVESDLGATSGRYWIIGLALINVLVWWAMEGSGGSETRDTLLRFGAVTSELIGEGQWWRTVTAVFIHIGARHLLGNTLLLLVLGLLALRAWGPGRALFIYVLSGTAGNWASFVFGSSEALKAGASAAILGLLGGLAGARLRQLRRSDRGSSRFRSWHIIAMLVAFYGFVVGVRPSSDHVAHVGGIASGMLVALLWPYPGTLEPRRERRLQLLFGCLAALLTLGAATLALMG